MLQHMKPSRQILVITLVLFTVLSQFVCFQPLPSYFAKLPDETKATILTAVPHDDNDLKSACDWNTSKTALWTKNTAEENVLFGQVQACHRRLYPDRTEIWVESSRPPPSSLRCDDKIMNEFKSIISSYDNLIFMGDSLIRQQFVTMLCMLDPSTEQDSIAFAINATGLEAFDKMRVVYNDSQNKYLVSINYLRVNMGVNGYRHFQKLTGANATEKDLFILNQGAWYQPETLHMLQRTAKGILQRAQMTNATIFYMETVDFQWPSSNGQHVELCSDCQCEPLTPQRIRGDGNFTGPARYLGSGRSLSHSVLERFKPLYADFFERNHSFNDCIPYCLPANWRNDVTNSILSQEAAITIVPIWKQLVSFGFPQNRRAGDCTHKSTDALIAMNQQLLRSMKRRAMEF
jgi:hypothetical protein